MEILYNFGFEWILFFAQIVNFLVIYFVMKKFLFKPILSMLHERKKKIDEGLADADEAARLKEETVKKEQDILKKAQSEAKKLIDDAKTERDDIIRHAETEAKVRADKILSDAREQLQRETVQAQKDLSGHVSKIAVTYLTEAVRGLFSPGEQQAVITNALKKLKKKAD